MMKDAGHVFVAIALAAAASSACAMTAPADSPPRCHVVGGEKLLASSGGTVALCEAVERAVARRSPDQRFMVEVRIEPRSVLTAVVTLGDGRVLPALHMAEMDRPITKDTLDRFGSAIVDHAAIGAR